jgi:glycine/D-amino acid oxidase-like deaminating enzyme
VFWELAANISNPLAVTQAYTPRFKAFGGAAVKGDALRLHQTAGHWRVDTAEGPIDAEVAVVALGPWAPDLLVPLGVKLPLAGQARLSPALPGAWQCLAGAADPRCRERLLRRAHGVPM